MRDWKDTEHALYFYSKDDGRIVGQVHGIVHTNIWLAKVIFNHNHEEYLGQFITMQFAKMAVEDYWCIQDRTLLE